jgi:hypothetical protein
VASSHWPCPCCRRRPWCCPCDRRRHRPCRRRRCPCHCRCRRRRRRRRRRPRPRRRRQSPLHPRSTPTHLSPRARSARRPGCMTRLPQLSPRSRPSHRTTPGERREPEFPRTRRRTPPPSILSHRNPPMEESVRACACCSCPWRKQTGEKRRKQ